MTCTEKMTIILASTSPRRRDLLTEAGYAFETAEPQIDEPPVGEPHAGLELLSPRQQAEALAYFKARSVWDLHPDHCVLGADTICAVGNKVLGKPADADDARSMLKTLSHNPHQVITGVAILGADGARLIASDVTNITMRPMSDEEIEQYIASGEWEGKAGAYAIQETADRYVTDVDGSLTNVVGLPMELVEKMIREFRDHPQAHRDMLVTAS